MKFKFPRGKWELVLHPYLDEPKDKKVIEGEKEIEIEGRTALVYRRVEY